MDVKKIKIAVQVNGRLRGPSLDFLKKMGVDLPAEASRSLIVSDEKNQIDVVFVRHNDIPRYVFTGAADLGIMGENLFLESGVVLPVLKRFDFGKCALVIAVPKSSKIKSRSQLQGLKVATAYPNSLRNYLSAYQIDAEIIELRGSVEASVKLKLADAICDITQTGQTLRENNLVAIEKILDSQAILVRNEKVAYDKGLLRDLL